MGEVLYHPVASHDKYDPYMQKGQNLILQRSASAHPWTKNQIPVQSAEIHNFGRKYAKCACLKLQHSIISTNLNA